MMVEELMLDEGKQLIPSLLQQLVFETNVMTRLQAMDTLLSGMDEELKHKLKTDEFKLWLSKHFLKKSDFMRQLKLYSKINENVETAIEYHGQDYITHSEFVFNEEFEKKVMILTRRINNFVGKLIKEYSKGEKVQFDTG
jgi:hypothetical protein